MSGLKDITKWQYFYVHIFTFIQISGQSSYGHRRSSPLDKILDIPKGILIGVRRIKGGLIALKGGWVRGQAAYLNNHRLSEKGNDLIAFGKKVAGPGPYGPKAPF